MPEFGSQEYWETRFKNDARPFDWLLPAHSLRDLTAHWMHGADLQQSEILHIGCGTSDSSILCELVQSPYQIHNVDFSQAAIDAGSVREKEILRCKQPTELVEIEQKANDANSVPQDTAMRWSCLDVLSTDAVLDLIEGQTERSRPFDLIIDKSTSDSIACREPLSLSLPYPLSVNGWSRSFLQSEIRQHEDVHPLHVLAVHLAALTSPKTGTWIAVSYSEDRFPFCPPFPTSVAHGLLPDTVIKAGFPHPENLWRLVSKEKIEIQPKEETLAQLKSRLSSGSVHRPKLSYWLYVMVRTDAVVVF